MKELKNHSRRRVLLVATTTGYQIRSFSDAAETLGVRLLFASDRCDQLEDPWWDQAIAVRFHDEAASMRAVATVCAGDPPDAIVAVGDRPTMLAARLNAMFGLPGNPPAAAAASRNKRGARQAFRAAGLPTPAFRELDIGADSARLANTVNYPVVIKPLALSGSRGVIRVDDALQFGEALKRLRRILQSPDIQIERDARHGELLVEEFIPGAEYAVEGVLTQGAFQLFAIFDKPDPLDGPFFEETIYVTPSRQPTSVQQAIVDTVVAGARALGLRHGPVHAECRVNDSGVYLLEIAARPIGGICSRSLRFTRGEVDGHRVSLEEVLLRHVLGEDVSNFRRERRAAGVMMVPIPRRGVLRHVAGIDQARAVPGIDEVTITAKQDAVIVPLPEGRSYLGFIFAHGKDAAYVEGALRDAHRRLQFAIDRELTVT